MIINLVKDGEIIEKALSMVPIRITVVVTLRELQPLAGKTQKQVRMLMCMEVIWNVWTMTGE